MRKFSLAVILLISTSVVHAANVNVFDPNHCALILEFKPGGKSIEMPMQPHLFDGTRAYTPEQTRYIFDHPEASIVRLFARASKTPESAEARLGTPMFWINTSVKSLEGQKRESATITRIDKNPFEHLDRSLKNETRVSRYLEFTLEDAAHFEEGDIASEFYLSPAPHGELKSVPKIPLKIQDSEFAATILSRYWFEEFMMELAQITRNTEVMRSDRVSFWANGRISINLTGLNYSEFDHVLNLIYIRLGEAHLFAEKARKTGS